MRPKTFIAMLLACAVLFSLASPVALGASADPLGNLPSDTDKGIEIMRTAFAPDIDGLLDKDVYTEIYSFSGEDAWEAAPAGGGSVDYGLLTMSRSSILNYIFGGYDPDWQLEYLFNSHVKGYAAWDSEKIYFLVVTNSGGAPISANQDCYWGGSGIQIAVNPKDGPDLVANSNGGDQIDHFIAMGNDGTAVANTASSGAYDVAIEDQDYAIFFDGDCTVTYEWSYDLSDFELNGEQGEEMLFAILHNFNAWCNNDEYDWFGYQVGTGVVAVKESDGEADHKSLKNSLYLVFSEGDTEETGEYIYKYVYQRVGEEVIITDVDESISGDVVVPAFIQGYPVVKIADYAFSDCDNITGIVIPEGIVKIGTDAFSGCDNLKSVVMADSVTSIGSYAFMHCVNLTEISLSSNLETISDSTFYNCDSLKHIEIPSSVQVIGSGAFNSCSSLTEISLPDTVKRIGNFAFSYCTSLTSVTLPVGVAEYGSSLFESSSNLRYIMLPAGVENLPNNFIGYSVDAVIFLGDAQCSDSWANGWNNRELVVIWDVKEAYTDTQGVTYAIKNDDTAVVAAFDSSATELELAVEGYEITEIVDNAFRNSYGLLSVKIPDTVTKIGSKAFSNCGNLSEINMPQNLEKIGNDAFSYCYGIRNITIPESVLTVGERAFYGCNIKNMTFMSSSTEIYDSNDVIPYGTTLHGYEGSTAQAYAEKYGRNFALIVDKELGDVDGDGVTNSDDAVAILRYLAGYDSEGGDIANGDFNSDGTTNSDDAVAILRMLAGYND